MTRIARLLFSFIVISVGTGKIIGQSFSGRDFWLIQPNIYAVRSIGDTNTANAYFVITGNPGTKVKFFRTFSKISDSLTISSSGMDTLRINYATHIMPVIYQNPPNKVISLNDQQIFNRTLHVSANDNIDIKLFTDKPIEKFDYYKLTQAYVYPNALGVNHDLGSAQPIFALQGSKDRGLTFTSINGSSIYESAPPSNFTSNGIFIVIAGEDSAHIEIKPNAQLMGGYAKGVSFQKWLNKGEMFYAGTDSLDLTGSTVKVLNCKPITVFTGVNAAPRELIWKQKYNMSIYPWHDGSLWVYGQRVLPVLPDQALGYRYLIPTMPAAIDTMAKQFYKYFGHWCPDLTKQCPPERAYTSVQCVALFDNTKVRINNRIITLNKKGDTRGDSIQQTGYIESDKPVSVVWMPGGIRGAGTHMLPAFNADTLTVDTFSLPCAWERLNTGFYRPWKSPVAMVMAPGPGKPTVSVNGRNKLLQNRIQYITEEWYYDTVNLISNYHNKIFCERGCFGAYSFEFNGQNIQNIYPFGINNSVQWLKMKVNGLWNMRFNAPVRVCQNTPSELNAKTDWYVPKTLKWLLPYGKSDTGATIQFTFPDTGLFPITIIAERPTADCDNIFITDTLTRMVRVYSLPQIKLPADTAVCHGTELNIKAWRSELPRPVWFDSAVSFCNACDSVKILSITKSKEIITSISKTGCSVVRDTMKILIRDTLELQLYGDTSYCYAQQSLVILQYDSTLSGGAPLWNIPVTQKDTAKFRAELSKWVKVNVLDFCLNTFITDSIYIVVHPPLNLDVITDTLLCLNDIYTVDYKSSGGHSDSVKMVYWNNMINVIPKIKITDDTIISLILKDGCSLPDSADVLLRARGELKANWNVSSDTWCISEPIPLTAYAVGGDTLRYFWKLIKSNIPLDSNSGKIWEVDAVNIGNGVFQVELKNVCGTIDTFIYPNYINYNKITLGVEPDTICPGIDTISGVISGALINKVYIEYPGYRDSVTTSGDFQFILNPAYSGDIMVHGGDGCSTPDTVITKRHIATSLSIKMSGMDTLCAPVDIKYSWQLPTGGRRSSLTYSTSALGNTSSTKELNYSADKTHMVYACASDGCSTAADSTEIVVIPHPDFQTPLKDTAFCVPFDINIDLPPAPTGFTWRIDPGSGNPMKAIPSDPVIIQTTTLVYNTPGVYKCTIMLGINNRYCQHSLATIKAVSSPVADFNFNPQSIDITEPKVQFVSNSQYATYHFWQFTSGNTSTQTNPDFIFTDTGNFPIQLKVANTLGCEDSITKYLRVYGALMVYIPTAFTPAGVNQSFIPIVYNGKLVSFQVYNRWGEKIHDGTEPFYGNDNMEEVVIYRLTVQDNRGRYSYLSGSLHILR